MSSQGFSDENIIKLFPLIYRNLKDEYQDHLEQSGIDFPKTEKLASGILSNLAPPDHNKEPFKIVITNSKGPRAKLFYRLFGEKTNIDFQPYDKTKDDFFPNENDCKNESEDMILVNTAFEKSVQYLQKIGQRENGLVISQITRMFLKGRHVEKAPKDLTIEGFRKIFDKSPPEGIPVTTAISILHCGHFLSNSDLETIANRVKGKNEYQNRQDIKDDIIRYKIVDSKCRLIIEKNELPERVAKIREENRFDELSIEAINNQVQALLSHDFYKVKLGYGKSYLNLRKTTSELSKEDCEIICQLLITEPLKYLNLLDLEYFDKSELKPIKTLLSSKGTISILDKLKETLRKMGKGYPDSANAEEWSRIISGISKKKINELEKSIIEGCKKLKSDSLKKCNKIESLLITYIDWNKHVGKMGGLRVQDRDIFLCVSKIEGDPFTVVGFPIEVVFRFLHEFGIETDIDVSSLHKIYWPAPSERQKILYENQFSLLKRKSIEQQTLQRIKTYGNIEDYGWDTKTVDKIREHLTLIKLAYSINNLSEMKDQIDGLNKILKKQRLEHHKYKNILAALSHLIPDDYHMNELSNGIKLEIVKKIDEFGNVFYNPVVPKSILDRELENEVVLKLEDIKQFQLHWDRDCTHLEKRHYSTINIPAIEKGIIKFNEFLLNTDNNIKTFLLMGLNPPELITKETLDQRNVYLERLSNNYSIIVQNVIESVFKSIKDSFNNILKANELNQGNAQGNDHYIVDDWDYFKDYINKEIGNPMKSDIIICLGNNGTETMMSLWIAYLLLHFGFRIHVLAKAKPSMGNDCTKFDLEFVIPYFEYLINNVFREKGCGFFKPLRFFVYHKKLFIEIADNRKDLEKYLKNYIKIYELKKILTLIIGEVWYTEIVGTDELKKPPYTLCEGNGVTSTGYSLHVHKNRKKPLAVMNQNVFTRKGIFVAPELTTGWYVSQIFRPIAEDSESEGWKIIKNKFILKNFTKENDLIKLINDNKVDFEKQLTKECRAYAGLSEEDFRAIQVEQEPIIYTYKSPHKFVTVTVNKNSIDIELLMEYDYSRILRTGGTEWRTIKKKIPRLIAAIFTGLYFRQKKIENSISYGYKDIELVPENGKASSTNDQDDIRIDFDDDNHCKEIENGFSKKLFYEISILLNENIKTDLEKQSSENIIFTKIYVFRKSKNSTDHFERRTRIYPARFIGDKITTRIHKLWEDTVCISIQAIAYFDCNGKLPEIRPLEFEKPLIIKMKDVSEDALDYDSADSLTVDAIRNTGAIAGPLDALTTCDKRVDFIEAFYHKFNKKPIAFTELIRVGSIFLNTDLYYREYWTDPNYLSGLPRMEISSEEGPVIFQLAGPHNLPTDAPDWIFKKEIDKLNISSVVNIFSASAQLAIFAGAAAIDINMCCEPMYSQGGGTRLLEDHNLAYEILGGVRSSIDSNIPLSCKTRFLQKEDTGSFIVDEDESKKFYMELFKRGANWITVETRIRNDGQGLLNDNTARNKRGNLANIINQLNQDEPELMKQCFIFLNGEVIHRNNRIDDFKDIKDVGCKGAVISMGNRVDCTIIWRCKKYLHKPDISKEKEDPEIKETEDPEINEIELQDIEDRKKLIPYLASIIRGHDCANCNYRSTCREDERCIPIASQLLKGYNKAMFNSIKAGYISKRLSYLRREQFNKFWKQISAEKQKPLSINI